MPVVPQTSDGNEAAPATDEPALKTFAVGWEMSGTEFVRAVDVEQAQKIVEAYSDNYLAAKRDFRSIGEVEEINEPLTGDGS